MNVKYRKIKINSFTLKIIMYIYFYNKINNGLMIIIFFKISFTIKSCIKLNRKYLNNVNSFLYLSLDDKKKF